MRTARAVCGYVQIPGCGDGARGQHSVCHGSSAISVRLPKRKLVRRYWPGTEVKLIQLSGGKVEHRPITYPIPSPVGSKRLFTGRQLDANKLLRDRNGGLWVGTVEHGLIHASNDRSDVFTKSDGLSGDIVLCIFEDREANVWVSTTGGFDRFRDDRTTSEWRYLA